MSLLDVRDLRVQHLSESGPIPAVDGVNLTIDHGEVVGVVGESGCGKSTLARAIIRLDNPRSTRTTGEVFFEGTDLLTLPRRSLNTIRGARIAMVFQNPQSSLNPVMTIGTQVAEILRLHSSLNRREIRARVVELLDTVGIPNPAQRARDYPHQLSGGQQQRVAIAIALACSPRLLIADEPTTALDVTIQAQILSLIHELCQEMDMAVLLISHNLGVISQMCSRAHVMYGGVVVEEGPTERLFDQPRHPYTRALLGAMPSLVDHKEELETIPGIVPRFELPISQCRFADRCAHKFDDCGKAEPPLELRGEQSVRCWLPESTESKEKAASHG